MRKMLYTNIIILILIAMSEVFNFVMMPNRVVEHASHGFMFVTYRVSYDVLESYPDFTSVLILIGIILNIRFLLKNK